jgi:hypothetical protein
MRLPGSARLRWCWPRRCVRLSGAGGSARRVGMAAGGPSGRRARRGLPGRSRAGGLTISGVDMHGVPDRGLLFHPRACGLRRPSAVCNSGRHRAAPGLVAGGPVQGGFALAVGLGISSHAPALPGGMLGALFGVPLRHMSAAVATAALSTAT